MEIVKQDSSIACDDVCYLNQMPRDILDYIAGFLMESEEEFIERTRVAKKVTVHDDIVVSCHLGLLSWRCQFCPDEKKYLVLGRKANGKLPHEDMIAIVDSIKNRDDYNNWFNGNRDKKILYKENFDNYEKYTCHGLSRGGGMIAFVYEEKKWCGSSEYFYDYFKIQKIDTLKTRELYIPDSFLHKKIAFNKQGTHIIAHGECYFSQKVMYKITQLKIIDSMQMQVEVGTTNKLQEYLRDKYVCNTYIEGKK